MKKILLPFVLALMTLPLLAQYQPENGMSLPLRADVDVSEISAVNVVPPPIAAQARSIDPALAMMFQEEVDAFLDDNGLVGLSAAVNIAGDIWTGTAGKSSNTTNVSTDMLFGIGSVSKSFASSCLLSMQEEGALSLDDPIGMYISTFDNVDPSVTVRQLLNHTSGIYNYTDNDALFDSVAADFARIWMPGEVIETFVLTPNFAPGTDWGYSNTNYILAGLVVEAISGQTYHEEIRSRFLEPMGLNSIVFYPYETPTNNPIVHLWLDLLNTGTPVDATLLNISLNGLFSAAFAAGGFMSTPEDITKWMRAVNNGEVFSAASLAEFQTLIPFGGGNGAGLGIFRSNIDCSNEVWGHGGDIIYTSQVHTVPMDDFTIAVHCNDGTVNSNSLVDLAAELHCIFTDFDPLPTEELFGAMVNLQIVPNPSHELTQIRWEMTQTDQVQIIIYNELGKEMSTLLNASLNSGKHQVDWNTAVAPGVYWAKVKIGHQETVQKIIRF